MEKKVEKTNREQDFRIMEFPGYYESHYCNSSSVSDKIEGIEINSGVELKHADDWEVDMENYKKDLGVAYTDFINEKYRSIFGETFVLSYKETISPRFYNFEMDKMMATLEIFDEEKFFASVRAKMNEHKEELRTIIYDNHTSRGGFISYMENDIEKWYDLIEEETDKLYLECVMSYIAKIELGDLDDDFLNEVYFDSTLDIENYIAPQTDEAMAEYDAIWS